MPASSLHPIGCQLPEHLGERLAARAADRPALLRELLPWVRREGAMVALPPLAEAEPLPPQAVLFDLDATLMACEFLDTLAGAVGLGDATHALTRAAMEGRMEFAASYRERLCLLAGTPVDRIEALIDRLPLAPGAAELIAALRRRGIRTAIVTGGYARVARAIQQRLEIDRCYATELEERDGRLTGRLAGPLLDAAAKVAALDDLCTRFGVRRAQCVAVGDGANDLPLLAAAGWGVLYTACPDHGRPPRPISSLLEAPCFHI